MFTISKQIRKVDVWEGKNTKRLLIIHDTASQPKTAFSNLLNFFRRKDDISVHYTVNYDGTIVQLADENDRCFHAGVSEYEGMKNVNNFSIGIEVFYNGSDFTDIQREAVIWLCHDIMLRNGIPAHRVLRHADVARPMGRKNDVRTSFYSKYGAWGDFQVQLIKRNSHG